MQAQTSQPPLTYLQFARERVLAALAALPPGVYATADQLDLPLGEATLRKVLRQLEAERAVAVMFLLERARAGRPPRAYALPQ